MHQRMHCLPFGGQRVTCRWISVFVWSLFCKNTEWQYINCNMYCDTVVMYCNLSQYAFAVLWHPYHLLHTTPAATRDLCFQGHNRKNCNSELRPVILTSKLCQALAKEQSLQFGHPKFDSNLWPPTPSHRDWFFLVIVYVPASSYQSSEIHAKANWEQKAVKV
jgi:hypothetical protein